MNPSGRQVEIAFEEQVATVVEVGGGLRRYVVSGVDVLDGYAIDEMCESGRGEALLPWPNRIAGGAFEFDGVHHQLALGEPSRGNAIHGLTRFANWTLAEVGRNRATMTYRLHPQPGYPFLLDLRLDYRLGPDGLHARQRATNRGSRRCPFGAGAHPYVRLGDRGIDALRIHADFRSWYEADERGIPVTRHATAGSRYDFAGGAPLTGVVLDTAFTDLARNDEGRFEATIADEEGEVVVWVGPGYTDLMLYTGDTLGAVDRRRQAIAIEPMSCPPNAFRTGERLVVLEPGQTFEAEWGISSRSRG